VYECGRREHHRDDAQRELRADDGATSRKVQLRPAGEAVAAISERCLLKLAAIERAAERAGKPRAREGLAGSSADMPRGLASRR
jgi:hypothetical protein